MDILIGILIGTFILAALSADLSLIFLIICMLFNTKRLNFYTQLLLYSLLIAFISFMCIIIIKA
jgi:hypothetical protein